jgi:hypothetical protein
LEDRRRRKEDSSDDIEASFNTWYRQYPKHVAKSAALKAYRTVIAKKLATPDELLTGAMRYASERSGQDPKYTKHPSTWLNAGCWADESPVPAGVTIDSNGNQIKPPPDRQPVNAHAARVQAIMAQMMAKGSREP